MKRNGSNIPTLHDVVGGPTVHSERTPSNAQMAPPANPSHPSAPVSQTANKPGALTVDMVTAVDEILRQHFKAVRQEILEAIDAQLKQR